MKAIQTKYLGPTNFRGTRIKATAGGNNITIPLDYDVDEEEAHRKAAIALCEKLNWPPKLLGGCLGGSWVWVFAKQ